MRCSQRTILMRKEDIRMNNINNSTRLRRITNGIADSMENSVIEAGQKMISVFINDASTWIMNAYENWKKSQSLKLKYEELQQYIEASNETIQIGMDKKELAVMWAMHELGYSEEKTKEVLDLANKAYLPKERR